MESIDSTNWDNFEPLATLPEQWLENCHPAKLLPEHALQLAVLTDAVAVLRRLMVQPTALRPAQRCQLAELDAWVNTDYDSPFSFAAILDDVSLNGEAVAKYLNRCIKFARRPRTGRLRRLAGPTLARIHRGYAGRGVGKVVRWDYGR